MAQPLEIAVLREIGVENRPARNVMAVNPADGRMVGDRNEPPACRGPRRWLQGDRFPIAKIGSQAGWWFSALDEPRTTTSPGQ